MKICFQTACIEIKSNIFLSHGYVDLLTYELDADVHWDVSSSNHRSMIHKACVFHKDKSPRNSTML